MRKNCLSSRDWNQANLLLTNKILEQNGGFCELIDFVGQKDKKGVIMAQTEVNARRLIPEDKVYRQIFDAEVSFRVVFTF